MEQLKGQFELLCKSCVYCFTHYCSAECQNKDLKSHCECCFLGKIYYYIEKLNNVFVNNKNMNQEYYIFSWKNVRVKGRCCSLLTVASPDDLARFINDKKFW